MKNKNLKNRQAIHLSKILDSMAKFILENKIASEIHKAPLYNDEPKIFNYTIKYETKNKNIFDVASGVSFKHKSALIRVLGEAIERYSINHYAPKVFTTKTLLQIEPQKDYLNPIQLSPFSKQQLNKKHFRQFKIEKDSVFRWTDAFSVSLKRKIFIPCQIVSFNYDLIPGEPLISPAISTGTAFGISIEDALYRAVCEIIERDAFIISYLNKISVPIINLKYMKNKEISNILNILERYKLEIFVLDLTTDIKIPVFAAIVIDKTGLGPAVSIGLKSGFEIKEKIIGAIEEALMTRSWIRDKFIYINPKYKNSKDIINLEQRAYFWFSPGMVKNLNFWLKNKRSKKIDINKKRINALEDVLNILEQNGMTVIYKDITPQDLKSTEFKVIRVVIPGMQALYLDERFKFLGNKRLYEVPGRITHNNIKSSEDNINPIPHPFL